MFGGDYEEKSSNNRDNNSIYWISSIFLIGTFASDSTVATSDNVHNITLTGSTGEVIIPAGESKTVMYQITNTNKGVVKYGVAYAGDNITVKYYYDTIDPVTGLIDYGENKFIKLYIVNSGETDSVASIKTVLGYENGGELDVVKPTGYTFVTEEVSLTAYAVYSADDTSLRFYKTVDTITEGSTYRGRTATAVYTGVEDSIYTSSTGVPWEENYANTITNVVVEDIISPVSTAYWFYGFDNVSSMNLTKLDTSNVTDMKQMFHAAGQNAAAFKLDLSGWDTSNVTTMTRCLIMLVDTLHP